jgi:hypothetical protein
MQEFYQFISVAFVAPPTGFIFESGNSAQLAEYIIKLIEDNSKCIEMGRNAYQKMLHEMSLEECSYVIKALCDKYR